MWKNDESWKISMNCGNFCSNIEELTYKCGKIISQWESPMVDGIWVENIDNWIYYVFKYNV